MRGGPDDGRGSAQDPDEDDGAIQPPDEPQSPTEGLLPDEADAEDVTGVTGPLWRP